MRVCGGEEHLLERSGRTSGLVRPLTGAATQSVVHVAACTRTRPCHGVFIIWAWNTSEAAQTALADCTINMEIYQRRAAGRRPRAMAKMDTVELLLRRSASTLNPESCAARYLSINRQICEAHRGARIMRHGM